MAKRRQINPFQPILDRLPAPLKNKYVLTLIVFLFIMLFVNRINPLTQWRLQQHKTELEQKKAYYEEKMQYLQKDKRDNERNVEKFAREKYYMKQKDEEVFIIVEGNKDK